MEKVSVIIPVYNTEKYLEKSFDSILNQTYTNLELIVINDGSNEATTMKLKEYAKEDNRIKLFEFTKRQGVGHARNYGLSNSTGKYIYYFDSDDYLESNVIEKTYVYEENNPEVVKEVIATELKFKDQKCDPRIKMSIKKKIILSADFIKYPGCQKPSTKAIAIQQTTAMVIIAKLLCLFI